MGEVTRQVIASSAHYINTHSQKVGTLEFKREINLSIVGFLAGHP